MVCTKPVGPRRSAVTRSGHTRIHAGAGACGQLGATLQLALGPRSGSPSPQIPRTPLTTAFTAVAGPHHTIGTNHTRPRSLAPALVRRRGYFLFLASPPRVTSNVLTVQVPLRRVPTQPPAAGRVTRLQSVFVLSRSRTVARHKSAVAFSDFPAGAVKGERGQAAPATVRDLQLAAHHLSVVSTLRTAGLRLSWLRSACDVGRRNAIR